MKPICVKCKLFFHPERNGIAFEEGMPRPTPENPAAWGSYKLWVGDLWKCRGCGAQIVTGSSGPIREHYEEDYAEQVRLFDAQFRVDDC